MSFFGGIDSGERADLYELINVLLERIDVQRRLNEDLTRRLAAADERLRGLELLNYGMC
jgi:hypothetical protein